MEDRRITNSRNAADDDVITETATSLTDERHVLAIADVTKDKHKQQQQREHPTNNNKRARARNCSKSPSPKRDRHDVTSRRDSTALNDDCDRLKAPVANKQQHDVNSCNDDDISIKYSHSNHSKNHQQHPIFEAAAAATKFIPSVAEKFNFQHPTAPAHFPSVHHHHQHQLPLHHLHSHLLAARHHHAAVTPKASSFMISDILGRGDDVTRVDGGGGGGGGDRVRGQSYDETLSAGSDCDNYDNDDVDVVNDDNESTHSDDDCGQGKFLSQ